MDVTKENFKDVLPSILRAIDMADFVAIDAEFTGLRHNETSRYCELDTPEERYAKSRDAAQSFGMIQFGVTTFRYIKEMSAYSHATFCFYLLGKTGDILYYDNCSLKFLADNGFDFNKLYKSGLSYLSLADEANKRLDYAKQSLEPQSPSPIKVTEESAKKFLEETESLMEVFVADKSQEVLVLPGTNISPFFRKILYNNIAEKFKNILVRIVPTDGDRNVEIRKFDSKESRIKFLEDEREQRLDEKIGFTHVVRKILEVGKPIVGHNLVLDLLHMMEKMVQTLPEKLEQFKSLVKCSVPTVYDTKLIAKDPPFCVDIPVTSLGAVYSDVCSKYSPPVFVIEDGYESYDTGSSSKAHDAGYDAFMTGVCFVTMVKKLDGSNWKNKSVVKSKHLNMYANRVNNMSSYDIPFLNLVGPDVQPDRSKIFCVECPSSWTTMHVHGLFHMIKPLKIVWVSSTFLYVIPMEDIDKKSCRQHLKNINASCPPLVRVKLYGDTLSSKRKSASDEEVSPIQIRASRIHDFKRLKSVGSDQLSKMTLESPSAEEPPSLITGDNGRKATSKQDKVAEDVFTIPDEW